MAANPFITVEDVRHFMMDRTTDDNDLLVDLAYSDDEIKQAMVRAARDFNSVPPLVVTANPEYLDAQTNLFLDGIAKHLYMASMSKSMRNDMDYTAGGVSTNIEQKRIEHMKFLIQMHDQRFKEMATTYKVAINIAEGFGSF